VDIIKIADGTVTLGEKVFVLANMGTAKTESESEGILEGTISKHRLLGRESLMVQGHMFPVEIAEQIVYNDKRRALMAWKLQTRIH
jgi:hypothetical protein